MRSGERKSDPRGWALVTGASSGIGEQIARNLGDEGWDLIVSGRREDRLEQVAGSIMDESRVRVRVIAADLAASGGVRGLVQALEADEMHVGILVNSAGVGDLGPFLETEPTRIQTMIHVNVTAVTQLTRCLLPGMVGRGRGRILNVASIAAFQPGPRMAVYYATKAYLLSFSEALREELRGTGVSVTTLCPGPTRSGFHAAAGIGHSHASERFGLADPREVAAFGVRALFEGKAIAVPELRMRAYLFALRLLPRAAVPRIMRRLQEWRG